MWKRTFKLLLTTCTFSFFCSPTSFSTKMGRYQQAEAGISILNLVLGSIIQDMKTRRSNTDVAIVANRLFTFRNILRVALDTLAIKNHGDFITALPCLLDDCAKIATQTSYNPQREDSPLYAQSGVGLLLEALGSFGAASFHDNGQFRAALHRIDQSLITAHQFRAIGVIGRLLRNDSSNKILLTAVSLYLVALLFKPELIIQKIEDPLSMWATYCQ